MSKINDLVVKFTAQIPVEIEGLISAAGIELDAKADLHPLIVGQIEPTGEDTFKISANGENSRFRRRFTLAHEFAHYILHRHLIGDGADDTKAYRSMDVGRFQNTQIGQDEEIEASKLATKILMPSELVRAKYEEHNGDVAAIAKEFQVSSGAMGYRLEGLGLSAYAQE